MNAAFRRAQVITKSGVFVLNGKNGSGR